VPGKSHGHRASVDFVVNNRISNRRFDSVVEHLGFVGHSSAMQREFTELALGMQCVC